MASPEQAFHAHLDECKRCRENPMNLCITGRQLLVKAATEEVPRA